MFRFVFRALMCVGIVIALNFSVSLVATAQSPQMMSLHDCIKFGIDNDIATKRSALELNYTVAQEKEAYSNVYPQINGKVKYENYPELPTSILPGVILGQPGKDIAVQFGTKNNFSLGAELSQVIYNQAVNLSVKAVRAARALSEVGVVKAKENVVYNIAQAYLNVLVLQKQRKLLTTNLEKIGNTMKVVEVSLKNGFSKKIDLNRLQVAATNLQTELQNVDLAEDQLLTLLKYNMAMPLEQPIALSDTLKADDTALVPKTENAEPADVRLLAAQRGLMNIQSEVVRSGYYPSAAAFASYQVQAQRNAFDFFESKPWYRTAVWGVQINVPIFDGFNKRAKIEQWDIRLKQNDHDQQLIKNGINLQKRIADRKLQTNRNALTIQKRNADLAAEILSITREQYRMEQTTLAEVLNAESALKEAQGNYLKALADSKIAELDVLKASGNIMQLAE